MELREYLFRNRMTVTEFAKKIDYARSHTNLIVTGTRVPSPHLAAIIKAATNGQVTEKDFATLAMQRIKRRHSGKK